jgi:type IV pilus assembly protein PilC
MPTYHYVALDPQGNEIRGQMAAESQDQVLARIRENQLHLVNISAGKPVGRAAGSRMQSVKLREKVVFTRQFATMVEAALSILRCLDILVAQTRNPFFRSVLQQVRMDIQSGLTLADSMAKHPRIFDDLYVNMIRAAEMGGILDVILDRLAEYLEKEQEIRTKIKSAMMYPCVVFAFALLMATGIVFFVLPKFRVVFEGLVGPNFELPLVTELLMSFGDISRSYWYIPVMLIIGLTVAYNLTMRTEAGRFKLDSWKLKIPIVGDLMLKVAVSRVCRTLGTLMSSGIPILRALEIVEDTAGNAVVATAINQARAAINEGQRMCEPLVQSGVFPLMVTQMIQVGEETGRIDEMLQKVADFYEEEVDAVIKGLTSLIEPIMIVGLGIFVAFVAVAVLMPVYSVISQLGAT